MPSAASSAVSRVFRQSSSKAAWSRTLMSRVPEPSTALLLVDVIGDFSASAGESLLAFARPMADVP